MHLQGKSLYSRFLCGWKKIAFIFILTLFSYASLSAQTTLSPGDIGIVGFNTSGDESADNFAFVLLTDVEAGTVIYFTDCGVYAADNCLRTNEGIVSWTAPAGGCTAGTMVQMFTDGVIIEGPGTAAIVFGTFALNVSGDQLIIFQHSTPGDLSSSPICPEQYLFALTNNEEWQADATDSHTSALPDELDASTSVAIPKDGSDFNNNATFDCEDFASGSAEDILAAITDPLNWIGSESDIVPLPDCIFTVGNFWVKYITYNQIQLVWRGLDDDVNIVVVWDTEEITDELSGDGSLLSVNEDFGTSGKIVYIGDNTAPEDTLIVITGLTEGQEYFFKTFAFSSANTSVWLQSKVSIPESAIAYVQEPTEPTATLSAGTNSTIDFAWTNYDAPTADWWDGGAVIIARETDAVSMDRTKMNALGQSSSDLSVSDVVDAVNGDFVAAIITDGSTTASETLDPCKTYHFRIFHNDGDGVDDKWSDGVAIGSVTTRCPEISVEGNSVEIVNGDSSPSTADHTDFGDLLTTSTLDRTFTIKNTGTGTITLSGTPTVSITGDPELTVTSQPGSTSLGALAETTFTVQFAPTGACDATTYTATISIDNSDTDENPYTFSVQGTCVAGCFTMSPLSGTPGTVVTITGAGFDAGTTAAFDGTAATVTYISATQITVVVPNGVSGSVDVTTSSAVTPDGCDQFNVIASPGTCQH